jgi:hypothetical protein
MTTTDRVEQVQADKLARYFRKAADARWHRIGLLGDNRVETDELLRAAIAVEAETWANLLSVVETLNAAAREEGVREALHWSGENPRVQILVDGLWCPHESSIAYVARGLAALERKEK